MPITTRPHGHMPDDGYNAGIGRGSDLCTQCAHPMGFHSSNQNDTTVKCHLGACTCNITYEQAMDRAAEIRGDIDQLKYNAKQKMERLQQEADQRRAQSRYVPDDTRFRVLQAELAETQRRYAILVEQASRRAELEVRPIYLTRTVGESLPAPGSIWIENEDVHIAQQEARQAEEPKKVKAVKPEPPARRVVKLPGKRGT